MAASLLGLRMMSDSDQLPRRPASFQRFGANNRPEIVALPTNRLQVDAFDNKPPQRRIDIDGFDPPAGNPSAHKRWAGSRVENTWRARFPLFFNQLSLGRFLLVKHHLLIVAKKTSEQRNSRGAHQ
jgi:hypothetical protein